MKKETVSAADEGIRLDRWFKRHYPAVPHGLIEKHVRKGLVRLDGKKTQSSARIEPGQMISFPEEFAQNNPERVPKPKPKHALTKDQVEQTQRMVLYRDEHIIVINKPAGLAVQGGTGIKDSVDARLDALRYDSTSEWLRGAQNERERPRLVHRLDKDTSGTLVLARDARTAWKLSQAFSGKSASEPGKKPSERLRGPQSEPEKKRKDKEPKIQKIYWALVVGVPKPEQGTIDVPLAKATGDYERVETDEDGKRAVTEYHVVERMADSLAWVELQPITGRTHQLRVHMVHVGCPIVGDGKYGGRKAFISGMEFAKQLHLHARRIVISGLFEKVIDVSAPLPEHMQESWKTLGL